MRSNDEWIASHDDQAIPDRVKLRVFEKYKGKCPKCTRKLQPRKWDCDHIVALINGGKHKESNLQPLCNSPCHSNKTKADVKEKSKNYRVRRRDAGIRKPRTITRWLKFDKTPVIAPRER
jgi:5-methylcytosine-specific restriction endonuclease McrA